MTVKNIGIVINFNPKSWIGGLQYFKNVHQICKNSKYTLNIICNKKNYHRLKKEFIDVRFIFTDIFVSFMKKGIVPNGPQGIYDELSPRSRNKLVNILNFQKNSTTS